jgi:ArsR family transcriptional regulator
MEYFMDSTTTQTTISETSEADLLEPLISLASGLLDPERLRIAGVLASGPANRMELAEATGLSHKDLARQLAAMQELGLIRLQQPVPAHPDHYSRYELDSETFRAARQAMGKYKGTRPRPTDSRERTLDIFMPGGKLVALPKKQEQIVTVLEEMASRFEAGRQYSEREVNVILEEVNEDYCTPRRLLVDYGYLSRSRGVYKKEDR